MHPSRHQFVEQFWKFLPQICKNKLGNRRGGSRIGIPLVSLTASCERPATAGRQQGIVVDGRDCCKWFRGLWRGEQWAALVARRAAGSRWLQGRRAAGDVAVASPSWWTACRQAASALLRGRCTPTANPSSEMALHHTRNARTQIPKSRYNSLATAIWRRWGAAVVGAACSSPKPHRNGSRRLGGQQVMAPPTPLYAAFLDFMPSRDALRLSASWRPWCGDGKSRAGSPTLPTFPTATASPVHPLSLDDGGWGVRTCLHAVNLAENQSCTDGGRNGGNWKKERRETGRMRGQVRRGLGRRCEKASRS